ncbi:MAG: hypothetical protein J7578_19640 [Chitinophagaceae bacterium]|nr:hypothetical protein [Chitinophagaceae bacterium]
MLINADIIFGTITLVMAECQPVMRMRPMGGKHSVSRYDGSNQLFIKRNRSGDNGS